jgi:hypothetical protein
LAGGERGALGEVLGGGCRSQIWRYLIYLSDTEECRRSEGLKVADRQANRLQDPQVFDLSAQSGRAAGSRGSVGMEITFPEVVWRVRTVPITASRWKLFVLVSQ